MKQKILIIPGVRDIESIQSAGVSSIPKVQRSTYLELYTLQRVKDRLEKEMYMLGKRNSSTLKQLESIDRRMEKLHKEAHKGLRGNPRKSIPTKTLKTMKINY